MIFLIFSEFGLLVVNIGYYDFHLKSVNHNFVLPDRCFMGEIEFFQQIKLRSPPPKRVKNTIK